MVCVGETRGRFPNGNLSSGVLRCDPCLKLSGKRRQLRENEKRCVNFLCRYRIYGRRVPRLISGGSNLVGHRRPVRSSRSNNVTGMTAFLATMAVSIADRIRLILQSLNVDGTDCPS